MRMRTVYIVWRCVHGSMNQFTAAFICAPFYHFSGQLRNQKTVPPSYYFTLPPATPCKLLLTCRNSVAVLLFARSCHYCAIDLTGAPPSDHRATVPSPCHRVTWWATVPQPCNRATVPTCYRATVQPCHRAIVPSCDRATVSPCHRATVPPGAPPDHYRDTDLPGLPQCHHRYTMPLFAPPRHYSLIVQPGAPLRHCRPPCSRAAPAPTRHIGIPPSAHFPCIINHAPVSCQSYLRSFWHCLT